MVPPAVENDDLARPAGRRNAKGRNKHIAPRADGNAFRICRACRQRGEGFDIASIPGRCIESKQGETKSEKRCETRNDGHVFLPRWLPLRSYRDCAPIRKSTLLHRMRN